MPDHTAIARFRQDHEEVAVRHFTDVLVLCAAGTSDDAEAVGVDDIGGTGLTVRVVGATFTDGDADSPAPPPPGPAS